MAHPGVGSWGRVASAAEQLVAQNAWQAIGLAVFGITSVDTQAIVKKPNQPGGLDWGSP